MPFDGSGNFNRTFPPGGWQGDAAADIKIRADRHDQHDADLAQGLGNAICRDGQSQVAANIPFGGFRITNLGAPVDANDAVTKAFADTLRNFSTGIALPGADLNGRLSFTAPTGVNGISWTAGDLFFGTRAAVANQSPERFIFNNESDASGVDVISITDTGVITAPSSVSLAANGYFDATLSKWRTPAAGHVTHFQMGSRSINLSSNVTATDTAYASTDMHEFLQADCLSGHSQMRLNKSASTKVSDLIGQMNGKNRWNLRLGNDIAESGADAGSNFVLYAYEDAGTVASAAMSIIRSTRLTAFYGAVSAKSTLNVASTITADNAIFQGSAATAVLASQGEGNVHLRPNGPGSATYEVVAKSNGATVFGGGSRVGGDGKTMWPWRLDSSVVSTVASWHHTFVNPNGQVGAISTTNNSTSYLNSSDERLKDFTGAFDPDAAAAIIKADPVRRWDWKNDGSKGVGWGAQTSHAVDPGLAEPPVEPDGNWGIDYGRRTPYLWAALSGALDKIAELEARLADLEARLEDLEVT